MAPNHQGIGRVNCVAFHPTDSNKIWAGAPSGGLWYSGDNGQSWVTFTDKLPNIGVSSILIHPTNPSIMYIGSGDRDGNNGVGLGVFKSTDGGLSWQQTSLNKRTVGMMVFHPTNPDIIVAATSGGIYKTIDGAQTWQRKTGTFNSGHYQDLKIHPQNGAYLYASYNGLYYRSIDGGDTWGEVSVGLPRKGRTVIGVSAAYPDLVYLVYGDDDGLVGVYKSEDKGANFSLMSDSPNILGRSKNGSKPGGQAWYDLCVAVNPQDAADVTVGGIYIWKSLDSAKTWTLASNTNNNPNDQVHVDIHSLDYSPHNNVLYSGNDGGVNYTRDGGSSWIDVSSGLAIGQIYKIGQSSTVKDMVIIGTQDNGTFLYKLGNWTYERGGDGMQCHIDYSDTSCMYASIQNGNIGRSIDGAKSFKRITKASNGINEQGAWVTPYILHRINPNTMFAGFQNVWMTNNVKDTNHADVNWTKISSFGNNTTLKVIEHSRADTNKLWVVRGNSIFFSSNIFSPSPVWQSKNVFGTVTDIEAHWSDPNKVYCTSTTSVYETSDGGLNWISIKKDLPDVIYRCIVVDTISVWNNLYLGTEIGVFFTNDTMQGWEYYSKNLPVVSIRDLQIFYDFNNPNKNKLRAGTYGRGLWEIELFDPNIYYGIEVLDEEAHIEIYPNPANEDLNIVFGSPVNTTIACMLFNSDGLLIKEIEFEKVNQQQVIKISLDNYASGVYILRIESEESVFEKKVIIL
jgi:photosystem II stability/assembly factor-like uncharacterized protein